MNASTTIGILGAGQAGSVLARAFLDVGYRVAIANSRHPRTLRDVIAPLGPRIVPLWATDAAAQADVAILAFPYAPHHTLPAAELAGKVVLDNNNYMPWRDGNFPTVDSGAVTVHELRQAQLPGAKLTKAFSHIQFHGLPHVRKPGDELPALVRLARPTGAADRVALSVWSDFPETLPVVTRLYDELGFDTVVGGPLSESWRVGPGTPAWNASLVGQSHADLVPNIRAAHRHHQ